MKIGQVIRVLRKAKGLTLETVALAIDTDTGNLSRLERGLQGVSSDLLEQIAKALGTTVGELYLLAESHGSGQVLNLQAVAVRAAAPKGPELRYDRSKFSSLLPVDQQRVEETVADLLHGVAARNVPKRTPKKKGELKKRAAKK